MLYDDLEEATCYKVWQGAVRRTQASSLLLLEQHHRVKDAVTRMGKLIHDAGNKSAGVPIKSLEILPRNREQFLLDQSGIMDRLNTVDRDG